MTEADCQVFIVGEGPDDIGDLANPAWQRPRPRRGRRIADTGFIPPVVRRLGLERDLTFQIDGHKYASLGRLGREPREILAAKAKSAMALAASKGADALVFMHDVDNGAHADVVAQIEAGFAAYSPTAGLTRPVAVAAAPLATVEAWALGAPDALPKVFDDVAEPPRHPERLWGRLTILGATIRSRLSVVAWAKTARANTSR